MVVFYRYITHTMVVQDQSLVADSENAAHRHMEIENVTSKTKCLVIKIKFQMLYQSVLYQCVPNGCGSCVWRKQTFTHTNSNNLK